MEELNHLKLIFLIGLALDFLHSYNPKIPKTKTDIHEAVIVLKDVIKELPKDSKIIPEINNRIKLLEAKAVKQKTIEEIIIFLYKLITAIEKTSICMHPVKISSSLTYPLQGVEIKTEIECKK